MTFMFRVNSSKGYSYDFITSSSYPTLLVSVNVVRIIYCSFSRKKNLTSLTQTPFCPLKDGCIACTAHSKMGGLNYVSEYCSDNLIVIFQDRVQKNLTSLTKAPFCPLKDGCTAITAHSKVGGLTCVSERCSDY